MQIFCKEFSAENPPALSRLECLFITVVEGRNPCPLSVSVRSQTLIIYTIGNTRRRHHPTVITHTYIPMESLWSPYGVDCYNSPCASPDIPAKRGREGSPGFGAEPHQAHMVQISTEKFGGSREKMYLCTREPDSPTNRPGMSTPREDLAQRCSADSLRPTSMGFFCVHTRTRARTLLIR